MSFLFNYLEKIITMSDDGQSAVEPISDGHSTVRSALSAEGSMDREPDDVAAAVFSPGSTAGDHAPEVETGAIEEPGQPVDREAHDGVR